MPLQVRMTWACAQRRQQLDRPASHQRGDRAALGRARESASSAQPRAAAEHAVAARDLAAVDAAALDAEAPVHEEGQRLGDGHGRDGPSACGTASPNCAAMLAGPGAGAVEQHAARALPAPSPERT